MLLLLLLLLLTLFNQITQLCWLHVIVLVIVVSDGKTLKDSIPLLTLLKQILSQRSFGDYTKLFKK